MDRALASMDEMSAYKVLVRRAQGKRSIGRIILKWMLKKQDVEHDPSNSRQGVREGSCEHDNEHLRSIKHE
jgi:hypothetical protein